MGPLSTTSFTITASSNYDEIDALLATEDGLSWRPDDIELVHQIIITIVDQDKPISDIIMKGEYKRFVVTIQDGAGERPVTNKVDSFSFHPLRVWSGFRIDTLSVPGSMRIY